MGLTPAEVGEMTRAEFELYRDGYTKRRDELTRIFAAGVLGIINANRTRKDGKVRVADVFPWLKADWEDDGIDDEDVAQFEAEVEAFKAGLLKAEDETTLTAEERAKKEAEEAERSAQIKAQRAEAEAWWSTPEGRKIAATME